MHSVCVWFHICRKFEFLVSQGSVATCLRSDGQCHMGFIANFIRFLAVQKFWKSVKIWQSYRPIKGGNFFETQCIYGVTLAPPGEYYWTVRLRRRCGLMSNYFDHFFYLFIQWLWPPIVMGRPLYFTPVVSIFFFFLSSFFLLSFFFFSSLNFSGRRLDVYHTSTYGVAL